jgi:hypothetical protein
LILSPPDIMEEKAIVTAVHTAATRRLGKGLEFNSLHVSFQIVGSSIYNDKINKATFKKPAWLSDLQPSAPVDGYLMENGQFTVELAKDDRIKQDLNVTIEVIDAAPE